MFFTHQLKRCTASLMQVRGYAARKGTREKRKKAKVKVEVTKVGFIPHNQRNRDKLIANRPTRIFDDSWKKDPVDNVYIANYFKKVVYPFTEAVQCHKETHHPEMYNKPDADLFVTFELNMTRIMDNFSRFVRIPHKFDHGEDRSVIAFSKTPEVQKEASEAGAQLSGGVELIKKIQNGEISLTDFKFFTAHPEILPELAVLRGVMKRRFPNPRMGTLDVNLRAVIERLMHGIYYTTVKDEYEKDFGSIETRIGTLNMDVTHLEQNFAALTRDIYSMKPKRKGTFIYRCFLHSPPSRERPMVNYKAYLDSVQSEKEEEEEEEVEQQIAL